MKNHMDKCPRFTFLSVLISGYCGFLFLLPVIFILTLPGCQSPDKNVLATVGNRKITADDFTDRYSPLLQNPGLQDNALVRKKILEKMIDEELLIAEAVRRGLRRSPEGRTEEKRLEIQETLNAVLEKKVFETLRVQDPEIIELYRRLHTRVHARHLYADSQKKADSLYARLKQGKTFNELAKTVFQDPRLRDTGGDLGTFTADEMDPAFEDAAFTLDPGVISGPVRTAQGYSIIRVESRIQSPMLIESDYLKHRSGLEQVVLHRKRKTAARDFSDSLAGRLGITFEKKTLDGMLKSIQKERTQSPPAENGNSRPDEFFPLPNDVLVRSKLGVWDVNAFREKASFSSEVQQNWIRNRETLENFITGLIVREALLREAGTLNLDKKELERRAGKKMDDYLLKKMQEVISDMTPVPEDSIREYFDQNKNTFQFPPRIRLSQIALDEASVAEIVEKLLNGKADFGKVFSRYSVLKQDIGENGDIGFFTADELGAYAGRLMELKEGQWTGPLEIGGQIHFFKCTSRLPGRLQSYEEARPQIVKTLKPFREKETEKYILERIRQDVPVTVYQEKLRSIRLEQSDKRN